MDCNKIDYSKMFVVRDKKGYRISYNMNKFVIKTPNIAAPFGIEKYNGKDIINFEIKNTSNEQNNFIYHMILIDKLFHQFSDKSIVSETESIPYINSQIYAILAKELSGKTYSQFVKNPTKNKLIRTHIGKSTEIYKIENGIKIPVADIKGKNVICELELSNIWVYGATYGLYWTVSKIEVLE